MESVVSLQHSGRFRGTGFVVHATEKVFLVMTCYHVTGSCNQTFQVAFPSKTKSYQATVIHRCDDADLALLRFAPDEDCNGCPALRFADPDTTALNCGAVELIAYYETSSGRLLSPGVFDGKISGEPDGIFLVSDYTSEKGTSGGPVLKGGRVVGVQSRSAASARHAVSVVTVYSAHYGGGYMGQTILDSTRFYQDLLN